MSTNKPSKKLLAFSLLAGLAVIGQLVDLAKGGTSSSGPPAAVQSTKPVPPKVPELPPPTAPETIPPAVPTEGQLAMDQAYRKAFERNPAANIYKLVARRFKTTEDDVLEGVSVVAEYRAALVTEANRAVTDVVGDLDIKEIARTDLGTHTALVSFTATRCPDGDPRRDKQLEFLVTTALKRLATSLPAPIDSYRAALWYRGLSCDRGSMGYGATWTRSGGIELK